MMRRLSYPWLLAITLGFTETVSWGVLFYAFSVFVGPIEAGFPAKTTRLEGAFEHATCALVYITPV